jgi:hypothetical protein
VLSDEAVVVSTEGVAAPTIGRSHNTPPRPITAVARARSADIVPAVPDRRDGPVLIEDGFVVVEVSPLQGAGA